jgi:hypothetical protein
LPLKVTGRHSGGSFAVPGPYAISVMLLIVMPGDQGTPSEQDEGITYTFERTETGGWLVSTFGQLSPAQLADRNAVVAAIASRIEQDLDEALIAAGEYMNGAASPEVFYQCPGLEDYVVAAELFYECPGFEEYVVVGETPTPAVPAPAAR